MYLDICSFLEDFPIYWNIGFQVISNDSMDFLDVCCYLPFFSPDFTNLDLFQVCLVFWRIPALEWGKLS
jgi:hypothetical protein